MAQQVEHVLGKDEVTGSSPVSSSNISPLKRIEGTFLVIRLPLSAKIILLIQEECCNFADNVQ